MALNQHLQQLLDTGNLGFEDVFELYAALCINAARDRVNDLIADGGEVPMDMLSVDSLTADAVNWGTDQAPEMVSDCLDTPLTAVVPKLDDETWLHFTIRRMIEIRVQETKAFQIRLV